MEEVTFLAIVTFVAFFSRFLDFPFFPLFCLFIFYFIYFFVMNRICRYFGNKVCANVGLNEKSMLILLSISSSMLPFLLFSHSSHVHKRKQQN
jgi:hypothetical protein